MKRSDLRPATLAHLDTAKTMPKRTAKRARKTIAAYFRYHHARNAAQARFQHAGGKYMTASEAKMRLQTLNGTRKFRPIGGYDGTC